MPHPPVIPPFRNATDILHPPYRAWRPQPSRLIAVARKETDAFRHQPKCLSQSPWRKTFVFRSGPADGTLQIVPSNFRFKAFLKNL